MRGWRVEGADDGAEIVDEALARPGDEKEAGRE